MYVIFWKCVLQVFAVRSLNIDSVTLCIVLLKLCFIFYCIWNHNSTISFQLESIAANVLIRECCWPAIRGNTQRMTEFALSKYPHPALCCLIHLQSSLFHLLARHSYFSVLLAGSHNRDHIRGCVCVCLVVEGCGGQCMDLCACVSSYAWQNCVWSSNHMLHFYFYFYFFYPCITHQHS